MRRKLALFAVMLVTGAAIWYAADRPAVQIEIEPGGHAFVAGLLSRAALPETVSVRQAGSHTVIRIVNHDTHRHQLGPFDVEAGRERDFVVAYAGTFGGFCSTHDVSKQIVFVVE